MLSFCIFSFLVLLPMIWSAWSNELHHVKQNYIQCSVDGICLLLKQKCCFCEVSQETNTEYAGFIVLAENSWTACLKWWNYWILLFFHESYNGCWPRLWPLFSNEMIECSELSNSFCLAVFHTVDMPPSHAQCHTGHDNTLQWPQLPAFLKKAQGHLQFRIQVKTSSFALFGQHEAKFGLHSTQSILFFQQSLWSIA